MAHAAGRRWERTLVALVIGAGLVLPIAAAHADQSWGEAEHERDAALAAVPRDAPSAVDRVDPIDSRARLRLVWMDVEHQFPPDFDEVAREVAQLFHGVQIELDWRVAGSADGPAAGREVEIPIIALVGDRGLGSVSDMTLGATWREGPPPRPIWIYTGALQRALGSSPTTGPLSSLARRRLARPLARVIAHEVVHALVPERGHAARGLMQAVF